MFVRALKCLFVTALITALGTGCRYRDPSIDLLENELRWMEDQVFSLEDELASKCVELAACRQCDVQAPTPASPQQLPGNRYQVIQDEPSIDLPSSTAPPEPLPQYNLPSINPIPSYREPSIDIVPENPAIDLPRTTPGNGGPLPDYQTIEPDIDIPTPADPRSQAPSGPSIAPPDSGYQILEPSIEIPPSSPTTTPAEASPLNAPRRLPQLDSPGSAAPPTSGGNNSSDPVQLQSFFWEEPPASVASPEVALDEAIDAHVTHIVAEAEITTAYGFDGEPTAPGLLVVVEPRNSVGRYVALAGEISVVVLDGAKAGKAARVGRWDFDASETRRRIRSSSHGRGVHLVLPWNDASPESNELHLFVRYTTVEGRTLEDDMLLSQGRSAERWSATSGREYIARPASSWSASGAPRGVLIETSPITLPVANPDQIELRPIPSDMAESAGPYPSVSTSAYSSVSTSAEIQRPEWKPYR